eukprot:g20360.t2
MIASRSKQKRSVVRIDAACAWTAARTGPIVAVGVVTEPIASPSPTSRIRPASSGSRSPSTVSLLGPEARSLSLSRLSPFATLRPSTATFGGLDRSSLSRDLMNELEARRGEVTLRDRRRDRRPVLGAPQGCPPRVAAAGKAFAMWCPNGGCIAWGDPVAGGDCSSVAEQLWPVKESPGSYAGFAALRSDGRVTCWGDVGVETELPSTLRDIQQLQSTNFAYATLDRQGRVYCWGDSDCGGDAGHLALENVATLASAGGAFAAICHDGSHGGGHSVVVSLTSGRRKRIPVGHAGPISVKTLRDLIAEALEEEEEGAEENYEGLMVDPGRVRLKVDGIEPDLHFVLSEKDRRERVFQDGGGDSSHVSHQLVKVQHIWGSLGAFAALRSDGQLVTWGDQQHGGDSSHVQEALRDVMHVATTDSAFAALCREGDAARVVAWGHAEYGGDTSTVERRLSSGVRQITGSLGAFAAVLVDGGVVCWGHSMMGGDSSSVQEQLRDVVSVTASGRSFAALRSDQTVVTWGAGDAGGVCPRRAREKLQQVVALQGTEQAFVALRSDGQLVTWGNPLHGGDCTGLQELMSLL